MSKIRILAIPPDTHGVGKYRILDPFKFLGDNHSDEFHIDIVIDGVEDQSILDNYNIIFFHSFIIRSSHEANVELVKTLKSKGIKLVMDIDDFWNVDRRHPMYHQIVAMEVAKKKVELLKLADWVTCTTEKFASTIKQRLGISNVVVFPNAIDENEPQFQHKPTESEFIRFGWLGGSSHQHDLELVRSGISMIGNQFSNTQFVLCGFDLRGTMTTIDAKTKERKNRPILPMETVWYKYEQIFTDNYKFVGEDYKKELLKFNHANHTPLDKRYVRVWTQPVSKYGTNYNMFDVSLAPLVESEFNANKSQLKAIEAGFQKKALIASETLPYTLDLVSAIEFGGGFNDKGNALLVSPSKNHKQWAQHMKRLVENPNLIEDLGNKLYETVKDKYSLQNVTKNRIQFFKSII